MYQVIQIGKFDGEASVYIKTFSTKDAAQAYLVEQQKEPGNEVRHLVEVLVDGPEISWIV